MDSDSLTQLLRTRATDIGADLFGIADARYFRDPGYTGNRPQDIMENVRSVVVIGVAVPRGCIEPLPKGRPEYTNTLMAGTAMIRIIAFQLARVIEREGFRATIIPTEGSEFGYWYADRKTLMAGTSIKYAAYCAGLGTYGVNHLLITGDFGARVRMTAVVTDAPLAAGSPTGDLRFEGCRDCLKCIDACPARAFSADGKIDRHKCAEYMFTTLGGLRCGLCIRACPR